MNDPQIQSDDPAADSDVESVTESQRPVRSTVSPNVESLQQRLERLEDRLLKLRGMDDRSADDALCELADVDRELRSLRHEDRRSNPAHAVDNQDEGTTEQTALGGSEGVPEMGGMRSGIQNRELLAELDDWQALCRSLQLDEPVQLAEQLIQSHLEDALHQWKQSVPSLLNDVDPQTCFLALRRTTSLRLQFQVQATDPASGIELLIETRDRLRRALQRALERAPASARMRQSWVTELLDLSDTVTTSIDNLSPDLASAQVSVVADDCKWHLDTLETRFGRPRRQLQRKLAHLRAERQERRLQHRMEERFGRPFAATLERVVLFLVFLVVGLMFAELILELTPETIFWFNVVDAAACSVFLFEFFTKLWLVPERTLWFRRHFIIDFIPSIPFGLLTSGLVVSSPADAVRVGRLARLFRIPRLARYVRILRPIIRLLRGFGLLARGLDRLVRRYGHLLNQNVILYPTRVELNRARSGFTSRAARLRDLRRQSRDCWNEALLMAPAAMRPKIASVRIAEFEKALDEAPPGIVALDSVPTSETREIPASVLIDYLRSVNSGDLEAQLSPSLLKQLARMVRVFSGRPLCWFPLISSCVPDLNEDMTDAKVTAAAAQRLALVLKRYHDAWFWVADLYGTVTPSQFVDRVGTALVNGSFRPAYKLAMFGGILLLTQMLLYLTALQALEPVERFLGRYVGLPVLVMGAISFIILAFGWWLKRLAREATEFYERSAQAQYLALMETIRSRFLERDAAILYNRVLHPEWMLAQPTGSANRHEQLQLFADRARQSLIDRFANTAGPVTLESFETTLLVYRDWLDGALLTESDTRATSQLLGNPAVRQFLSMSARFTDREAKRLQRLDLVRQKSMFGGPYLWFNFISRSITHSVACLLVDYNQNAIPLSEINQLRPASLERYRHWIDAADTRLNQPANEPEISAESRYVTNAFTAMHFLDVHPQRDQAVEIRFGPEVLERLKADRSLLIRRIFGTYPMHDRPKQQRVVNLYSLYGSWLAGGRALMLPLLLLLAGLRYLGGLLGWIAKAVQEIRHPERRRSRRDAASAHFFTAIRKIDRIRGPVVDASLRLRIRLDPEFLGVPLPGSDASVLQGADVDADLSFLNPELDRLAEIEQERLRAQADMQRLDNLIQDGLLRRAALKMGLDADTYSSAEHLRTAAVAYLADLRGVRRLLSAQQIVDDTFRLAATLPLWNKKKRSRFKLARVFRRYWKQHGFGDARTRRAARRATVYNLWGVADALQTWQRYGDAADSRGEQLLGELLLHPGRITEQLTTIRVIQTLAVLDVLHYRQHVYDLGRYADMGDSPSSLLQWDTVPAVPVSDPG